MPSFATAIVLLAAYLLGSIPFGVILTRLGVAGDLRQIGSGNIGATNVLRTGRKGLAAATLVLDGAKGAVTVLIAHLYWPDLAIAAGGAAFLGHLYPIWLKFDGGKGVAIFTRQGIFRALTLGAQRIVGQQLYDGGQVCCGSVAKFHGGIKH